MKQWSSGFCKKALAVLSVFVLAASACAKQPAPTPSASPAVTPEATEVPAETAPAAEEPKAEEILAGMSLDEKISQMIIPAIRTWDEKDVTNLAEVPELAEALQRHQYGGIILYGSNVKFTSQTAKLVLDLQNNNLKNTSVSAHIPYFMPLDEEGGVVTRLASGTRMTGSMAIGATGDRAEEYAEETGRIIGEELASLGFNVDFAPVIDVNNNASNPVIGTRSFSDDPQLVSKLGAAFGKGLAENNVIATYKHFPGHGDTGTDSHIGTPSVEKTYDEIKEMELVPFREAVKNGAEIIMTAHITYPLIDEQVTFGDGTTRGYYPATMSPKIIRDILRSDMGYEGIVAADALEMDAIDKAGLVPGEEGSLEYLVNIAEKVILADVDIILLPRDMKNADVVTFYDDYISGIAAKVESGEIPLETIDKSVLRILKLKEKYGLLKEDCIPKDENDWIKNAKIIVGSADHHTMETEIAENSITVVKNDGNTLPIKEDTKKIVIIGRNSFDCMTVQYAIERLKNDEVIIPDQNIRIDYYFEPNEENKVHYTDEMKQAIAEADIVIVLSKIYAITSLNSDQVFYTAVQKIIEDTHAGGGKAVVLSDNLPYDSARFQDADAIVLAYMGSGLETDPSARADDSANLMAVNANVIAAMHVIFGHHDAEGSLPVNIPKLSVNSDGTVKVEDEVLYERGFGLRVSDND